MIEDPRMVVRNFFPEILEQSKRRFPEFRGRVADFDSVLDRYERPWRYFHNVAHLADCAVKLMTVYKHLFDPLVVWYILIYHDLEYLPGAIHWNEYCSSLSARKELSALGIPDPFVETVVMGVRATDGHLVPPGYSGNPEDLKIFLDIDLSGLGASREEFLHGGELLRKEYGSLINNFMIQKLQSDFCSSMLKRKKIFQSPHFAHLEAPAHNNLELVLSTQSEWTA